MHLGETFERFLQQAPISVLFRALLERTLDPKELDRLFASSATHQYTRELLFSSIVKLRGAVVCGIQPAIRAADLASLGEIAALLTAVSEKLPGIEPGVCRGFVPRRPGGSSRWCTHSTPPCPRRCRAPAPRSATATPWPGPN